MITDNGYHIYIKGPRSWPSIPGKVRAVHKQQTLRNQDPGRLNGIWKSKKDRLPFKDSACKEKVGILSLGKPDSGSSPTTNIMTNHELLLSSKHKARSLGINKWPQLGKQLDFLQYITHPWNTTFSSITHSQIWSTDFQKNEGCFIFVVLICTQCNTHIIQWLGCPTLETEICFITQSGICPTTFHWDLWSNF